MTEDRRVELAVVAASWTVDRVLQRTASLRPYDEAAVDGAVRYTWAHLAERVSRLTGGLRRLGLVRGETVGVLADNSVAVLEMYFAVPSVGLVLLPLNTRLADAELAACLRDAGCRVVVAGPGYDELLRAAVPDVAVVSTAPTSTHLSGYEDLLSAPAATAEPTHPDRTAYLYYTSGTTGRPKGVALSHRNVLSGAISTAQAVALGGDARWLHASPMFHLADAWAIWAITWLGGCHVVERFSAERTLRTLSTERITHTILVPTALERLAAAANGNGVRLENLRGLLYGGAPMTSSAYQAAVEQFSTPLIGTYGATETAGTLTVLPWAERIAPADGGSGRVGREVPGVDIAIVGADGGPVGPGVVGELVVTSPSVMQGYRNRPDETAAVLVSGRYHTGDLGAREDDGVIWLVGRSKDMIISGGENVYPAEVEAALALHPDILAIAVVGTADPQWGETIVAFVQTHPGSYVDLPALRTFGRRHLASYKLPRDLVVVDALPITGSGKIDKQALRARLSVA